MGHIKKYKRQNVQVSLLVSISQFSSLSAYEGRKVTELTEHRTLMEVPTSK
jgi:hypothetical protein